MTLREQKIELRREALDQRRAMTEDHLAQIGQNLCRRILALASYRYADHVLLYAPLPGEPDLTAVAEDALRSGKAVWFPRCDTRRHTMTFHRVTDLHAQLAIGAYGIREPLDRLPPFDASQSAAVCIVPGVLFDRSGYRIGYGGGYYDRFLPTFSGTKIGSVADALLRDNLPHGRFDSPVDILLTEKGVKLLNAR